MGKNLLDLNTVSSAASSTTLLEHDKMRHLTPHFLSRAHLEHPTSVLLYCDAYFEQLNYAHEDHINMSDASSPVPSTASSLDSSSDVFHDLVSDLSMTLGPDSGLTCDGTDTDRLIKLMDGYVSREHEWEQYAFADFSRGYTRNLVDEGNGKSNLLILVWTPGKGSPIHDHANSHCLMKILKGSLMETLYEWPDRNVTNSGKASPPRIKRETIYHKDQVTYMSDDLGLHRISNPDPENIAVSLHLYTPPNAAKVGCHIFEEKTGKRSHVSQCPFYSVKGVKV